MLARERHAAIEKLVKANNIVLIGEIAKLFGVSLETARRDLETLQDQGIVKRIHGGAILADMTPGTAPASPTGSSSFSEKKAIGAKAATLVSSGETIFLDTGTTVWLMASYLKTLKVKELTVITNSIAVINELTNSNIKIIVLGGALRNDEQMIYSYATEQMFSQYFVDKAFFGCGGITADGVTDYGETLDRANMARHAQKMVLLADSGKFGRNAKIRACDIQLLDTVVVDSNIRPQHLRELRRQNLEVIIAPAPAQPEEEAE